MNRTRSETRPRSTLARLLLALPVAAALAWPVAVVAQDQTTISGRVTAQETGAPLPGTSVFLQTLRLGAQTDDDGRYTITVPAARATGQTDSLAARRIGYAPTVIAVQLAPGATVTHDFTLAVNPLRLGEVVITGAGTATTRERLGNVVNSVDSTAITRTAEVNVVQALAGKAPNVEITQQSGEPGASSFIRIRGAKTIEGSGEPLFVVDGVPIDNTTISTGSFLASTVTPNRASDINPQDIESVEILKGAAAGAIYGARAANGVVLITTKQGRAGPTRASLTTSFGWDAVNRDVPLQRRFGQGDEGEPAVCDAPGCTLSPNSYGPELASGTPTFNHFDEMFGTGFALDADLALSGGTERTGFYLSGGVTDHQGTIVGPNNDYRRYNARLRATHRPRNDLEIGGNIAYTDSRGSFIQKGSNISGLMLGALRTPPDFDNAEYLDESGLHRSYRYPQPVALVAGRGYDNPFFVVNEHVNSQDVNRTFGNVDVRYNPLDWLDLHWTLGGDYYTDRRLEGLPQSSSDRPAGRVISADFVNYTLDHNLVGTARFDLSDNIDGTFTLGQNLNSRRFRQLYVTGLDLVAPEPFQLDNTITRDPDEFTSLVHVESYFGQAEFGFADQLYLTLAARNDGFSTFGESDQRHWFPKASLAWTASEVFNPQGTGFFNFAKLRAAYGQTGKAPEPYTTIQAFSFANLFDGGWGPFLSPVYAGQGGLYTSAVLAQPDIKPERTTEFEAGVDLAFLENRVDFGLTFYNSRSEDVIFQSPLAPSSGFTAQARNAATIRNRGFEIQANWRAITNPTWGLTFGALFGTNDNEVLDLQGAEFVDMPGAFAGAPGAAVVGSRVGVLRGNDFARCGRALVIDGVNIDQLCGGAAAGALFIGQDGFPILDPEIRVIMDPHPDWTASLRTDMTLGRRWQLSALVDTRQGNEVWNGTRGALYQFGTHKDTEIRGTQQVFGSNGFHEGAVAGPGAGTPVTIDQAWFQNLGSGFGPVASQFIEDGSFVKLREVSVSYDADHPFIQRSLGIQSLRIQLSGRNLVTWTDYTGIDPETNLGGAEVNLQGVDYFNNPATRTFVLTLGFNR
jgi:TonB-linked SusC/RagA family outer membrane protein